jgi:hypothetical protein
MPRQNDGSVKGAMLASVHFEVPDIFRWTELNDLAVIHHRHSVGDESNAMREK